MMKTDLTGFITGETFRSSFPVFMQVPDPINLFLPDHCVHFELFFTFCFLLFFQTHIDLILMHVITKSSSSFILNLLRSIKNMKLPLLVFISFLSNSPYLKLDDDT